MFIEVTVSGKKKVINTDHIVTVGNFEWFKNEECAAITLDSPLSPRGTIKMIVDESYEEIKKKLM